MNIEISEMRGNCDFLQKLIFQSKILHRKNDFNKTDKFPYCCKVELTKKRILYFCREKHLLTIVIGTPNTNTFGICSRNKYYINAFENKPCVHYSI